MRLAEPPVPAVPLCWRPALPATDPTNAQIWSKANPVHWMSGKNLQAADDCETMVRGWGLPAARDAERCMHE